jgi:hypothetical protein
MSNAAPRLPLDTVQGNLTQQNPAFCLGMLGKICEENAVEAGSDLVF